MTNNRHYNVMIMISHASNYFIITIIIIIYLKNAFGVQMQQFPM